KAFLVFRREVGLHRTKNPPEAAHLRKPLVPLPARGGVSLHVITGNRFGQLMRPVYLKGLPDVFGCGVKPRQRLRQCLSRGFMFATRRARSLASLGQMRVSAVGSGPRLEPDDVRAAMIRNQIGDVRAPALERVALFIRKVVALINAGDAGETAAGMVEELFDHRQLD